MVERVQHFVFTLFHWLTIVHCVILVVQLWVQQVFVTVVVLLVVVSVSVMACTVMANILMTAHLVMRVVSVTVVVTRLDMIGGLATSGVVAVVASSHVGILV